MVTPASQTSATFTTSQIESFLACKDFNASFKEALSLHYLKRGKINLADFSRRAGFSSRSYLSEVLTGKKGLSRDALTRIRSALKLPKPFLDVLEMRAYEDHSELKPVQWSGKSAADKWDHAVSLLKTLPFKTTAPKMDAKYVRSSLLYRVYAGLGSLESGASLADIARRTKLPEGTVESCLQKMREFRIVEERGGRFFVLSSQLDLFGLGSRDGLSELVSDVSRELRNDRDKIIDDPANTIFYTAFSTDAVRLPELKKRLKAAIFDVLDEFQVDDGDCVRQIFFVES